MLLALAALVCIFYAKVIVAPPAQVLGYDQSDTRDQYVVWRQHGFEALREGRLPLWNKYLNCGTPYLANVQSTLLYPLNAIFFLKNTARAINWSFILHAFLAGLGVALFLRELKLPALSQLCGSATFVFSAPFICQVAPGHLTLINTIAWTGFIFWSIRRLASDHGIRNLLLLSLFLSLALLAGNTHNFFYLMIAAALYGSFLFVSLAANGQPKEALAFAGAGAGALIIALGLCAAQIVPAFELSRLSARQHASYDFCSTFSFTPESLLTFLMPEFFGNSYHTPYWGRFSSWEMCAYTGIVPLALACFSFGGIRTDPRKSSRIFFGFCAVLFLVLALGCYTPLFRVLYDYVPGFDKFRGNSKFIFLTAFFISVLAGYGSSRFVPRAAADNAGESEADEALMRAVRKKYLWAAGAAAFILAAGFFLAGLDNYRLWQKFFFFIYNLPMNLHIFPDLAQIPAMHRSYTQALMQFLYFASIAFCFGAFMCIRNRKARAFLLLPLLLADLWSFGFKYLLMLDSETIRIDPGVRGFLAQETAPLRVVTPGLPRNYTLRDRIDNLEGYDPIILKDYYEYIAHSQGAQKNSLTSLLQSTVPVFSYNKYTDLLNTVFVLMPKNVPLQYNTALIEPAYEDGQNILLRFKYALPRAFFVNKVEVVPHDRVLERIGKSYFHPQETALVEEEPPFPVGGEGPAAGTIAIHAYEPEKIVLEIENGTDGLLVMSDSYYPGWQVRVNGRKEKIYKTDYFLRGVFLKAGKNIVEFSYRPASVLYGGIISLLSAGVVLLLFFGSTQKKS